MSDKTVLYLTGDMSNLAWKKYITFRAMWYNARLDGNNKADYYFSEASKWKKIYLQEKQGAK